MSENSRYSIIEGLTSKKLRILDAKIELEDEISKKEMLIQLKNKEREQWERSIKSSVDESREEKSREVAREKLILENLKKTKEGKVKSFDEKIKQIDSAMLSIEEISKASAKEASN